MNYEWKYNPPSEAELKRAEEMAAELRISPVLARVLINRGVDNVADARKFFRPQLSDLHDPFLFQDMQKAVNRLNEALGRKERILVYGDYDVDGCSAVALVYRFLQQFYSNIDYYIPDRNEDGYGVTFRGIDYASETGVGLIIVLDCGIKAIEEVAYAKERGIDFIICDHHVPGDELPQAVAVLDAKRADNTYPYEHLCGCGVGFKLMQAFASSNGIEFSQLAPLLDLCAISTAADIVPIMGENRILAFHGLRQLNMSPSTGVKALMEVCGLKDKEISLGDIIFKIGPRINASGRMQTGGEAVALLIEKDLQKARELAKQINEYNEQRKDLDKAMTEEANRIVMTLEHRHEHKSIVLFNEEWHRGIIGIVASRLTEVFYKPSVVLTCIEDGKATGSARSVPGFDVYKAVESCADLLQNFGGHTYAAGLTLPAENVPAFRQRFEQYVQENIKPEQVNAVLNIDAIINFGDIRRRMIGDIKRFAPYGPDNRRPLFCTQQVCDYGASRVVGRDQEHIRLELVDPKDGCVMHGIAFGQSSQARYIKTKRSFDIVYRIEENTHKHGEIQLHIEDIRPREEAPDAEPKD